MDNPRPENGGGREDTLAIPPAIANGCARVRGAELGRLMTIRIS